MSIDVTDALDAADHFLAEIASFGVADGPFIQTGLVWDHLLGQFTAPASDPSLDPQVFRRLKIDGRLLQSLLDHRALAGWKPEIDPWPPKSVGRHPDGVFRVRRCSQSRIFRSRFREFRAHQMEEAEFVG